MKDIIEKIINGVEIESICENVTLNLYKNGPNNITDMEILCYLCVYQTEIFEKYQDRILKYMGLSYILKKNIIMNIHQYKPVL